MTCSNMATLSPSIKKSASQGWWEVSISAGFFLETWRDLSSANKLCRIWEHTMILCGSMNLLKLNSYIFHSSVSFSFRQCCLWKTLLSQTWNQWERHFHVKFALPAPPPKKILKDSNVCNLSYVCVLMIISVTRFCKCKWFPNFSCYIFNLQPAKYTSSV